jgi:hypothetical protein
MRCYYQVYTNLFKCITFIIGIVKDIRKLKEINKIMHVIYNLNPTNIKLLTDVFLIESLSPCSNWSFINRLIVKLHDTNDARVFTDWSKVERLPHVHSAINIVIPVKKHVKKFSKLKQKETEYDLRFFKTKPVYRFEDTRGATYPSIELTTKTIMNKDEFMDKYELEDFNYEEVSECIEKLVPPTDKYDNELVRFLVSHIILALYNPDELDTMHKFDQIRKYEKNIIYYALSSISYAAKTLESLLTVQGTKIREQKNEYLGNGNAPLVN